MKEKVTGIVLSALAGVIIMIMHELPKCIVYYIYNRKQEGQKIKLYLRLHKYIDPIGLLFCITSYAGFSKPYMYRIKEKKVNLMLGITGFLSLSAILGLSIGMLKIGFDGRVNQILTAKYSSETEMYQAVLPVLFWVYLSFVSLGTIIVNLFPVSTFDLGLLIAGNSPSKYFSIISNDYFIKLILIFALALGVIPAICNQILYFLIF